MMGVMASPLEVPVERSLPAADFDRWMVSEQRRIFLLCYRMLGDRDEADTAVQDTFLKAYKALQRPIELDDPAKWLTRIAVNTCLDRLRSRSWKFWQRRSRQQDEELLLIMTPAGNPSAEDRVFAREIGARLVEALEQLSPKQRAVFMLKHYEDRRLDEIAEILGLELGTVKAHMARALARLRVLLRDLYFPEERAPAEKGGRP